MSYQVIARKYRPQTFADLTGQEHIAQTLVNALEQRRLHHAYLFSGVRGTGKTTTARILAKGLNCVTGMRSNPCLECDSCREIAAGNSIDVQEIDAASNTGVDNVRDVIINSLAIGPARDRYKVFIIDEVHMLSSAAFNALLKTLEEPPPHVVFVMATTELHKVPDTILSRCQHFEFRQISTEKIFQRLKLIAGKENVTASETALREIARAGAGSLRDAQSAFDQVIAFSGTEIRDEDVYAALGLVGTTLLERTTHAIGARHGKALLDSIEELSSRGYDLRNFARELMSWLRHLLVIKSGIENAEVLGVADLDVDRLKRLAADFSEEDLVRCFHLLAAVEKEIKESPLPRFALEVGLLKLVHMLQLQPLDQLIKRLEVLEARLVTSGSSSANAPSPGGESGPAAKATNPTPAPRRAERGLSGSARPMASKRVADTVSQPVIPEEPPGLGDFDPPDEFAGEMGTPNIDQIPRTDAVRTRGPEIEAIVGELERLNRTPFLAAFEEALDAQYQDGLMIVTLAKETIFASRFRDSQALFREIGERLFKQPLRVEVRIGNQAIASVDQEKQAREDLRQRALKSPAVKLFIESFQGEIVEVKELPTKPA